MKHYLNPKACFFAACLITSFLISCDSDDAASGPTTSTEVNVTGAFDVGNAQNAGDIYFSLTANTNVAQGQVRIFIVASSGANAVDLAELSQLPASAYSTTSWTGSAMNGSLNSGQTTIDGAAIGNGTAYRMIAYFVDANLFTRPSKDFTLTDAGIYEGSYVGTWNDNLYTDFGISATILETGSNYRGDFFYSNNFTSCCSGNNDGFITLKIEGNNITEYQYNQDLLDFMGGCLGLYNGSGRITSPISFEIDFEGEDCEGPHTNGLIKLTRIH